MNTTAPSLQDILERPQFSHTLPRDKEHPSTTVSNKVIWDNNISPIGKILLIYTLSLPKNWDGWRLPMIAAKFLNVSLKTGEKYVRELIGANYIRRISLGTVGDPKQWRYVITELPGKFDEAAEEGGSK